MAIESTIEAKGLAVERGERELFSDLSFTVRAGEVAQLRGPNGVGKTTLLRILAGLSQPSAGDVLVDGRSIAAERQSFGQSLAWCGHRSGLKVDLSVNENLAYASGVTGRRADPQPALARLGIENLGELPAGVLSAGQQRRAALARILLADAQFWLLDEPFTHLDKASAQVVCDVIAEHQSNGGTCILAAHELPAGHGSDWSPIDMSVAL